MGKKAYIDCTFTYQSGLNTGIQRVVRNIVSRAGRAHEKFGYDIQPVVCVLGRFYEVPVEQIVVVRSTLASVGQAGKRKLASLKTWFGNGAIASVVIGSLEWFLRRAFSIVKLMRMAILAFRMRKHRAVFGQGSVFVFADLFWNYDIEKALKASDRGVEKVVAVVYDLIPVRYPQFVEDVNRLNFTRAFPRLHAVSDHFICISRAVADDLGSYLLEKGYASRTIGSFRLGCDFTPSHTVTVVSSEIEKSFVGDPWLVVGTIEPRKNHGFILDAFERIWSEGGSESLVIIGRVGWMCEDIIARLEDHPQLNRKLFLFSGVSDGDLAYCYQHARGLIFASHAEGFGLPLVEAMRVGLPILCSDIPVFREVGGNLPKYFSLERVDDLVGAIRGDARRGVSASAKWPDWDASADEFWSQI